MTLSDVLNDQSEEQFQRNVIEMATRLGWRVAHFGRAMLKKRGGELWLTPVIADAKGFPDLVLVRERIIYAELKSEKGRLLYAQKVWKEWLEAAGQEWYMWKPSMWTAIEGILR